MTYDTKIDCYGKGEYGRFRVHVGKSADPGVINFVVHNKDYKNKLQLSVTQMDKVPLLIVKELITNLEFQFVCKQKDFMNSYKARVNLYSKDMVAYILFSGENSIELANEVVDIIEKIKTSGTTTIYMNDKVVDISEMYKYEI